MNDSGTSRSGITFLGALQVLFIGLKLTGYIDWPWYGVLAPLLCELGVLIVAFLFVFIAYIFGF